MWGQKYFYPKLALSNFFDSVGQRAFGRNLKAGSPPRPAGEPLGEEGCTALGVGASLRAQSPPEARV